MDDKIVISTFSGAMGLDNGIERASLSVRLCVEIEKAMADTIRMNKPELALIDDDIRNYSGAELRAKAGLSESDDVFLMCGGPPCQDLVQRGKEKVLMMPVAMYS